MNSPVHSLRRRTLVVGLAVASLAAASGALAGVGGGSDYAAPEVVQRGYGPGGPPSSSPARQTAKLDAGRDYGSAAIVQLGYGPGGPSAG